MQYKNHYDKIGKIHEKRIIIIDAKYQNYYKYWPGPKLNFNISRLIKNAMNVMKVQ